MDAEPSGRVGRSEKEELPEVEDGISIEAGEVWGIIDDEVIEEAPPAWFWTPRASATLFIIATSSLIPASLATDAEELATKKFVALLKLPPGELIV